MIEGEGVERGGLIKGWWLIYENAWGWVNEEKYRRG